MRVLIVDDSQEIRAEVRRLLAAAHIDVEWLEADTGGAALKIAMTGVDLILCDVLMPEMDGFQFLRLFRAQAESASVPVIMLTGRDVVEDRIFGLEAGASDYVTKPFIPGELAARVRIQLNIKALQDDLRQANERLKELAITDYLTGVFNRRHFTDLLNSEFRRSQRYKTAMSLALIDLDHFKQINDQYGHAAGDQVLTEFAALLLKSFRATDTVARFGGEEFVALLPHTQIPHAQTAIEKVLRQLQDTSIGGLALGALTFSAGVCSYPSDSCDSPKSLLAAADQALYRAKAEGRNRVICA